MTSEPNQLSFRERLQSGISFESPIIAPRHAKVEDFRKDHRNRLRQRFTEGGATAIPDYELLELVLFRAIPRQDVKPLARRLIEEFGDINHVMAAAPERLQKIKGVGASVVLELKVVEATAHRMARVQILEKPILTTWDSLLGYCQTTMAHLPLEQFRVLFLDRKNVLIADEAQQTGTIDHVPVYPREVVKRSLELDASAIILVHNHPSGDPTPSQSDLQMTEQIEKAAEALGIVVHDHLIIGKADNFSFRSAGLL